jgi:hypothetical protein
LAHVATILTFLYTACLNDEGYILFNYPKTPRYAKFTEDELEYILHELLDIKLTKLTNDIYKLER